MRVIGHRGACGHAPENTLAGLRAAALYGASAVEFDVKLTSDGVPILMHDDTLSRTTDGSGPVRAASRADLAGVDAGSWFGPEFVGEPVPALVDALALLAELRLHGVVELKPCPGREAETGATVAQVLAKARVPLTVSSFSTEALLAARRVVPSIPRARIVRRLPVDLCAQMSVVGATQLHALHDELTPDVVASVRARGAVVWAFTVDDPARVRELRSFGVEGVFSNRPERVRLAGGGPG